MSGRGGGAPADMPQHTEPPFFLLRICFILCSRNVCVLVELVMQSLQVYLPEIQGSFFRVCASEVKKLTNEKLRVARRYISA